MSSPIGSKTYRTLIAAICGVLFFAVLFWISVLGIAALVMMLSAEHSAAQAVDQRFDERPNSAHDVLDFDGTVPLAKNGGVLFTKGYGFADVALSSPNSLEYKYTINSVNRQRTSVAIMQLPEKGSSKSII